MKKLFGEFYFYIEEHGEHQEDEPMNEWWFQADADDVIGDYDDFDAFLDAFDEYMLNKGYEVDYITTGIDRVIFTLC